MNRVWEIIVTEVPEAGARYFGCAQYFEHTLPVCVLFQGMSQHEVWCCYFNRWCLKTHQNSDKFVFS